VAFWPGFGLSCESFYGSAFPPRPSSVLCFFAPRLSKRLPVASLPLSGFILPSLLLKSEKTACSRARLSIFRELQSRDR